jgi:hypothetical protein
MIERRGPSSAVGVWRKSSTSGDGECVEVSICSDSVSVRDSKAPTEGTLVFTRGEWSAFIAGVKSGEFDG